MRGSASQVRTAGGNLNLLLIAQPPCGTIFGREKECPSRGLFIAGPFKRASFRRFVCPIGPFHSPRSIRRDQFVGTTLFPREVKVCDLSLRVRSAPCGARLRTHLSLSVRD